ncbi:TerD family protein [Flavobacterium sp.]|uniref:TerD family protein n=1 Tax=Flavobacterium sp. TaxID=239 RepID=UPI00262E646A|nr:TerD family protein [Flavobacterium sp.]
MSSILLFTKKILLVIGILLISLFIINVLGIGDYISLIFPIYERVNEFVGNSVATILIGILYFYGADLLNYKSRKISNKPIQTFKPVLWIKFTNISLGVFIFFFYEQNVFESNTSILFTYLSYILFGVFIILPITIYIFQLIKYRKNRIQIDDEKLIYCFKNVEGKINYSEIQSINCKEKTGFGSNQLIVNCSSNESHILYPTELNINLFELYEYIYERSNLNDKLIKILIEKNKTNFIPKDCESNQFILSAKYPDFCNSESIDMIAFLLDYNQNIVSENHFVFYNNQNSPDESVTLIKDKSLNNANESISINLQKLPLNVNIVKIFATYQTELNSENYINSNTNEPIIIELNDTNTKMKIDTFMIPWDFNIYKSVGLIVLYKEKKKWKIMVSGKQIEEGIEQLVNTYCVTC